MIIGLNDMVLYGNLKILVIYTNIYLWFIKMVQTPNKINCRYIR